MQKWSLGFMLVLASACGSPSQNSLGLEGASKGIVGGSAVEAGDDVALSTVAIYAGNWEAGGRVTNYCSGTLIGRRTVLTAAHCVVDASDAQGVSREVWMAASRVAFGLKLTKSPTAAEVTFVKIANFATHEEYESGSVSRATETPMPDVAILHLEQDAPSGFRPAALEDSASTLQAGLALTLAGYGMTNGFLHIGATELRKVSVEVDDPAITKAQFTYRVSGGRSACGGDSGGPAYVSSGGRLRVVGITSWGDQNCRQIGAYTSVPAFADWIRAH